MNITHRFQRSFKPRFAVIYPFGIFVLLFCSLDQASLRAGIGFIIAGALIRLWSNGYAIKNDKLTTSGPYAFVRNPLYFGTFLIAIGFVLALKSSPPFPHYLEWIAGALFLIALALMYYRTIKGEEGMLAARYGKAYEDYCKQVPAMVPTLIPYSRGEKWPFNLQRLIKSKEHKTAFWVFIILVVFYLKTRLFIEHKDMSNNSWALVIICVVLILLDVAFELNKKRL